MTDAAPRPIRHVVFDIGRVLIHYDPHLGYAELLPDLAERQAFFDEVGIEAWNLEQDRGREWADAEAELVRAHPHRAELIRAFRRNWRRMVSHAYDDTVAILDELIAAGVDVTLLTNFASDTFREAQDLYPFLKRGRGVTVSGDIRHIKPDRAIFERHAAEFDLDPASTLFIDDSEKNVAGARAAGWQAVRFVDAPTLRQDLAARGLPVSKAS